MIDYQEAARKNEIRFLKDRVKMLDEIITNNQTNRTNILIDFNAIKLMTNAQFAAAYPEKVEAMRKQFEEGI